MKSLIKIVKDMSLKSKLSGNTISFLDNAHKDPGCQKIMLKMNEISLEELGIEGPNDSYHF
jgi:hypothetical protein